MIFDKDYDKALWMMLKVDKRNRERIAGFIRSIPDTLIREIQESFFKVQAKRENYNLFNDMSSTNFSGQYESHDKILYWFNISMDFNSLDMGYSIFNGINYEKAFEITLISNKDLNLLENFDEEWLGSIEYDIHGVTVDDKVYFIGSSMNEYNFVKTPFGIFIVNINNKKTFKQRGINKFNIDDIPEEIFREDINSRCNVNRLVRSRKKR